MSVSVLELFKIGVGPSSSHTVGPMVAARRFAAWLLDQPCAPHVRAVRVELFGSLGATGRGHGSDRAVILGLLGETPEGVDLDAAPAAIARVRAEGRLPLLGRREVAWHEREHLHFHRRALPFHPNGLAFTALGEGDAPLARRVSYSVGGGFVVDEGAAPGGDPLRRDEPALPFPFRTARELLARCAESGRSVAGVMLANENARRPEAETRAHLLRCWAVMQACVERGCRTEGTLPGGLGVERRAPRLARALAQAGPDPLSAMDHVSLWALAVNEENAAGGRVVTAPTNGAAGIVPAVLHACRLLVPGADDEVVVRFLLAAGAVGQLLKENASISGAEVGCQGEVGSAASMAAAGLAEVLGGTPAQVENAAEIAVEHHLGLTCDPVGGLVQIPCIERNAMAAVAAVNAARMALKGDGRHKVSLDGAIETMRRTGADMKAKYKETARGGLALTVLEAPEWAGVHLPEC